MIFSSLLMAAVVSGDAGENIGAATQCGARFPGKDVAALGLARSKSGVLKYCEWHVFGAQKGTVDVKYFDPAGQQLAHKFVNYASGALTPEFKQTDFRTGELRQAAKTAKDWVVSYRKNAKAKTKKKRFKFERVDVVDAGFVGAIVGSFDALQQGEPVRFKFASAAYQKVIQLNLKKVPIADCKGAENIDYCFIVEPKAFLLKLFADQLWLGLDAKLRTRYFNGTVNIQDNNADTQELMIEYLYP